MISGVLPRIAADNGFYSKAFSLNNRLETLCKEHGIEFVNMWNDFYNNLAYSKKMGYTCHLWGLQDLGDCLVKLCENSGKKTEAVRKASGLPSNNQRQSKRLPNDSPQTML